MAVCRGVLEQELRTALADLQATRAAHAKLQQELDKQQFTVEVRAGMTDEMALR